ncbi:hypothetical protein OGAPHI_006725 [Ogataea philodendri]|uniref:Xylanolytic transcriptional activator regulatory domain-containing protein n=1 Tax=Ogataea philodendri TaxID=1378263 RepID=A0A9P8NWT3_9ASCO|nr:uncharacterized protein OGAPHI_006725 [Ogataea philodendri]KAH3661318.1 hypothetical protein OGAPHI_006725 [Ogataea philodendri]
MRSTKSAILPSYVRRANSDLMKLLSKVKVDPIPHFRHRSSEKPTFDFLSRMNGLDPLEDPDPLSTDGIADNLDYDILMAAGCFTLPPEGLCWELIKMFFQEVYPLAPIVVKEKFMFEYKNLAKGPSIMLVHAILYAGAFSASGTQATTSLTHDEAFEASNVFYKRAHLLLDMGFDAYNVIPLMQTLLVFCAIPNGHVGRESTSHLKQAIITCCSLGLHLDQSANKFLTDYEKYMYRLIWLQLFIGEHARGMVASYDIMLLRSGCTVKMFTREEMYSLSPLQREYFLYIYNLSLVIEKIIGYTEIGTYNLRTGRPVIPVSEEGNRLLNEFYATLPSELKYTLDNPASHSGWSAVIGITYYMSILSVNRYTSVCSIRASPFQVMPPDFLTSWEITHTASWSAFQIYQNERNRIGIRCSLLPLALLAYQAAITMTYHFRNTDPGVVSKAHEVVNGVRDVLYEFSSRCLMAKVMYHLLTRIQENESNQLIMLYKALELDFEEVSGVMERLNTFT